MKVVQRFREWRWRRKLDRAARGKLTPYTGTQPGQEVFSRDEVLEAYHAGLVEGNNVGYARGRNDGVAIAKQAATRTLREIIWEQNKQATSTTQPGQKT
jgi:hypothetical protein